ncbi:SusD/RagB family nutrient-binding outer membrane lipoprotein [Adhaeribacter radiodurans]|nr:SusD/RagB family nutrient-binding outer membrane lipoprotein [Adhaeribacter radiodurans]
MKNIQIPFFRHVRQIMVAGALLLTACDNGFEEMNKNPNAYIEPVVGSLFSYNIIRTAGASDDNTLYPNDKLSGAFMQFFASLNPYQWTGDKYLAKAGYSDGLFNAGYNVELKENIQILNLTKDNPTQSNLYNIARIWRVYIMHRITDMYGDVPYFEAGQGYINGLYKPKYDPQSAIYADMLKELDEAALALDPAKPSYGAADFLYAGNTDKWKKFAYSLMLRLGMRLTKVDAGMAESWVKKAIAGGVMQSNADLAKLNHTDGTALQFYWSGRELRGGEGVPPSAKGKGYGKMAQTFVEHLKTTQDPRLPFYITLWPGNADPTQLPTSTEPSKQKGLPNGYDYSTIKTIIPNWTDDMLAEYSEINLNTVGNNATPSIFQSYAEVELYLAEAALRGWGPGDAKTHYETAVKASMDMQPLYPGGMSVTEEEYAAYLVANPYVGGSFDEQMEQIHTQLWASLFMNNIEVYANWRRTGYPKLTPTNYSGNETGGQIPRRLPYPQSEASLNTENYAEAVKNQGPDLFSTRVWWDKE